MPNAWQPYRWQHLATNIREQTLTGQREFTHGTIHTRNKVKFIKTYVFVITQIGCYGDT